MFCKGLIVVNAFNVFPEMKHMVERLRNEFSPYDVSLDVLSNANILAYIGSDGSAKTKKLDYDFIIYLDKDYYIAKLLESAGYRLFNNAEAIRICDDKVLSHLALVNAGIKMPKTINFPLRFYNEDPSEFLANVLTEFNFPFIIKEMYGSLGEQVYLVHNVEEFYEIENKIGKRPHFYQEYISTSFGKDMRVCVINGKYVASMKRVAQVEGEFKSNIETGGIGLNEEPNEEFKATAEKVAKIIGLDYCGLDLLYGANNEPILCEINANSYFSPIEKYSQKNVARPYVQHIMKEIYKI